MSDAQAPIFDLTGNTQSIEDSQIAPGTRDTYNQQLLCFIHYLYNNPAHLLDQERLYTLADDHDYCRDNE